MAYFKDSDFESYLMSNSKPAKYRGYIDTIINKILSPNGISIIFNDLNDYIGYRQNDKRNPSDGLDALSTLSDFIKRVSSLSKLGIGKSQYYLNKLSITSRSFRDYGVALDLYINYLSTVTVKKPKRYTVKKYNDAHNTLKKDFYDNLAVNGINTLLVKFGSVKDFINCVLQDTFFFSHTLAKEQFYNICNDISHKPVPARKSQKVAIQKGTTFFCIDENTGVNQTILISIDPDGNKAVRDLVENKTGYTISSGTNSIFTNYIISHIWGDAFDPRNFTNFWNLALVPAWANPLLDKTNSSDSLTKSIINTFKAICIKHYRMRGLSWKQIFRKCPSLDRSYVVPGDYTFYVIRKKNRSGYGTIVKKTITIP